MYALELVGEEDDFAAAEAATAAATVELVAPGLAVARGLRTDRVSRLAYTRTASRVVGRTDADVESVRALLSAAAFDDTDATVAVRARDVRATAGVSTSRAERELGAVLVDHGFGVNLDDPDRELRVSFAGDTALVGWLVAESVRDFGERAPTDRPFFQPGSMAPLDARAYANLAGAGPGQTILDPMCGTGGLLIEAGLAGSRVVGVDAQTKMVRGARRNLGAYLDGEFALVRGDGTSLPVAADAVDGVVVDAPYGRQSKVAGHRLDELVGGALAEAARVARRCVLVGDRDWTTSAEEAGWSVRATFARRVHRSLVRHVHVLDGSE
ncbi:methyltransferase domain-containing protein [Halobaculum sp. MBLA0143]|uniref:methyltransferase domain-containing protein n=1 Tax=Halobaculum sp. MBLA0143 TaxID=3079933 RepID=UPI003525A6F5